MHPETYDSYQANSALQQEGNEQGYAIQGPVMQEQVAQAQAVLVEQTNPRRVVEDISLRLRGLEKDPTTGKLMKVSEPLMNDKGIATARFLMNSIISQGTVLSHLEDKEISKIIIQIGDDLVDDLTLNWKEYGITDKMYLDYIVDSILFPSYLALKRALRQNEKNWLGRITVENIAGGSRVQKPKGGGFWDKFKL